MRFFFAAMGSPCELQLQAEDPAQARRAAQAVIDEVRRIEARWSRYRDDSLVAAINAAGRDGGAVTVDDETADLVDAAFAAYARSDGLFDITSGTLRSIWNDDLAELPERSRIDDALHRVGLDKLCWRRPELRFLRAGMEIDLGGLGKEYAADRAAATCRACGVESGVVDLGGDLCVIGPLPDGAPWRIGLRDPLGGAEHVATLFVEKGGVATSGVSERFWSIGGRRYGHILDPRSGWPVEGPASVTVAAPTCAEAGTAATIAMLKGAMAAAWLAATGLPHICVDENGALSGSALVDAEDARVRRWTRAPAR